MMQDSKFATSTSHKVTIARDARAEGGKRRILMTPSGVTIERHIHGIAMRVGIPATAYLGVALSLTGEAMMAACSLYYRQWMRRTLPVSFMPVAMAQA